MNNNIKKISVLSLVFIFTIFAAIAQISEKDKAVLQQNEVEIEKNQANGNDAQVANYMYKSAEIYWSYDKNSEALKYYKGALDIHSAKGNRNAISLIATKIGNIYADIKQYRTALSYFNKSVDAERKLNRKFNIAQSLIYVGVAHRGNKNYPQAIDALEESLDIAQTLPQDMNKLKLMRRIYGEFADTYRKSGDADNTFKYTELYKTFNDYVKNKQVEEIETESELKINIADQQKELTEAELNQTRDSLSETIELTEKQKMKIDLLNKQKMIDSLQQHQAQQRLEAKVQRQRTFLIGAIVIIILIIFFSFLIYRQFNAKKRAHKKLAEQYVILGQQKDKIEAQSAELSKKNKQITDSIDYARKIQEAILPSKVAIRTNIPDSFVFYRPKDIVSGDFYWFSKQENYLFIAAVDCTGHSVPGAFMSMIGNTLLNEIVNEKQVYKPSEILKRLNAGVIQALKQDGDNNDETQEDGMDLSLCRIDRKNKVIDLSLANHFSYFINGEDFQTIEGDIHSIGGMFSNPETEYTNHRVEYNNEAYLYMFSDGYPDQFGGDKNKKFMEKRFQEMIRNSYKKDFSSQYNIVEENFLTWKGQKQQTDDVLLIGLKIM